MNWEPIETAPNNDGWISRCLFAKRQPWGWATWVGQCDAGDIWLGRKENGSCWECERPTHWMPLPKDPE